MLLMLVYLCDAALKAKLQQLLLFPMSRLKYLCLAVSRLLQCHRLCVRQEHSLPDANFMITFPSTIPAQWVMCRLCTQSRNTVWCNTVAIVFVGCELLSTCAVNFVAFVMGKRYFLPITWLNLRRSALKVTKWRGKLGSGISNSGLFLHPVRGHVTQRMRSDCFR